MRKEKQKFSKGESRNGAQYKRAMWECLPHTTCWSPFLLLYQTKNSSKTLSFLSKWHECGECWLCAAFRDYIGQSLHKYKKEGSEYAKDRFQMPGEGELRGWAVELRTVILSRHRTQTASTHTSACNDGACGKYSYFHGRHTEPGRENSSLPHRRYQMHFKINNHILLTPTTASCFLLVNYKMSRAPGLLCFPICYLGVHTKIRQTRSKHNVVCRVRFLNDLIKSKGRPHICLW